MAKGHSIFYKQRDWDDFHFYHGTTLPQVKVIQPSVYYEQRGSISTTYHSEYYDRILPAGERNDVDKQQTIQWDSKKFNIEWPCTNPIISKRDANGN